MKTLGSSPRLCPPPCFAELTDESLLQHGSVWTVDRYMGSVGFRDSYWRLSQPYVNHLPLVTLKQGPQASLELHCGS